MSVTCAIYGWNLHLYSKKTPAHIPQGQSRGLARPAVWFLNVGFLGPPVMSRNAGFTVTLGHTRDSPSTGQGLRLPCMTMADLAKAASGSRVAKYAPFLASQVHQDLTSRPNCYPSRRPLTRGGRAGEVPKGGAQPPSRHRDRWREN